MNSFNQNNPGAIQGAGPSGTRQGLAALSPQMLAAEMALSQIGNFEPLEWKIDHYAVESVIAQKYSNDWVDYLPRTDRPNNRKALTLSTLEGWDHKSVPSLAEATQKLGRPVREIEFCNPTQLYHDCNQNQPGLISLKSFLDEWQPLGRTFIVNCGIGGYFVPHRDHPGMPRPVFRLVAFLKNVAPYEYDWWMDDRKANIEMGRVYYVNTRMTHRTISWTPDSWHMIVNVPMTPENVDKLLKHLQHRH
jgi:hypothetical protein